MAETLSHAGTLTLAPPAKRGRPLQSQEKPGLLSVEGPRTLLCYFSPLPCLDLLFWGGVVLSPQAVVGGGLGYWGVQKELWQCVYIGWPGEGTMLREDMGAPGCGSMMLYLLLSFG